MLFRWNGLSLTVLAPAKLNLFLEILGKRPDGFHEIETLMVSIGLYDTLSISPSVSDALSLTMTGGPPDLTTGDDNLILRAASLLRNRAGVLRGANIHLHKRIPVSSGLAGGSSDAAATLAGLNRLWQLGVSRSELMELAAELGSDIGFFFADTPMALCRGRGEKVESVATHCSFPFVIVRPRTGLSTAEVYQRCRPSREARSSDLIMNAVQRSSTACVARSMHNSLQIPAMEVNEEVLELRARFDRLSIPGHQMSGSGTAYFGICRSMRQAHRIAARLRGEGHRHVFVARSRA